MQVSLARRDMSEFDASAFATPEEKEMLLSIARLDLSHNFLHHTKGLQCLVNLTELDVSHNKLLSLANLPLKLRRIDASYNNLAELEGLGPLAQLEYCDLSYNAIPTVATPGALPATTAMRYLDLSHNRLASLSGVESCPGLHVLKADCNLIRGVAAGNEHDELTNVESLRGLKSLRVLTLANNPISKNKNTPGIQLLLPRFATLDGVPVSAPGVIRSSAAGEEGLGGASAVTDLQLSRQSDHSRLDSAALPMAGSVDATATNRQRFGPSVDLAAANGATRELTAATARGMFAQDGHLLSPGRHTGATGERVLSPKRLGLSSSRDSGRPLSPAHSRPSSAEPGLRRNEHVTTSTSAALQPRPKSADSRPRSDPHFSRTALRELSAAAVNESTASHIAAQTPKSLKTKILPGQTVPLTLEAEIGGDRSKSYLSRSAHSSRSAIDASVPAVEVQRLMESRIHELERAIDDYKGRLAKAQGDNETLRMQLTQARETVARQGQVNAILADANRELSTHGPPPALGAASRRAPTPRGTSPSGRHLGHPATTPADLPAAMAAQARQAPKVGWSPHVHQAHVRPSSSQAHSEPSVTVSRSSSGGRGKSGTPQPSPRTVTPRPSSRDRSTERLGPTATASVQGLVFSTSKAAPRPLSPPQRSDRAARPTKSSAIAAAMYMKTRQSDSRSGTPSSPQQTADRLLSARTATYNAEHPPHKRLPSPGSSGGGVASNYASLLARSGPAMPHSLRPSSNRSASSSLAPPQKQTASAHATRPASAEAKLRSLLADLSSPSRDLKASNAAPSITPPKHRPDSQHSSSSGRNVSFGGSRFYSPPTYS